MPIRILIIDDHPLYIRGVQALLEELDPQLETCAAGTIEDAVRLATARRPSLILLDLKLPGAKELQSLSRVRLAIPEVPIVVVSGSDNREYACRAVELGAAGYIPKDMEAPQMAEALRRLLRYGVYLPEETICATLAEGPSRQLSRPRLTQRQVVVLQSLLQGKSNKLIGQELNIAEGTVKNHLWAIYQALGVSSRLQVMARAYELGFLDDFSRLAAEV